MTPARVDRLSPVSLVAGVTAIFRAHGVPADDAALVADSLVRAELWGHPSHGLLRVRWYVDRLRSGVVAAVTAPSVVLDAGAVAVLDGNDGVGQVVAARAMREALERARAHGVGVVAVRRSNHFGTAAYFTRMAPPAGCIGVLATNSSPAMAPWGGRDKLVGANPWSVAAPAGRYGMVTLDIANTAVARGKVYAARQQGLPIPEGWAMNSAGEPTTDPEEALAGLIMPMAGHKGYAISFTMDVLAGVLSGSAFGPDVRGPQQAEYRSGCGHYVQALDIASFMPVADFAARMETLIGRLKGSALADGADEVCYPGELEDLKEAAGVAHGIAVAERTLGDLQSVADEAGVRLELVPPGD